MHELSIAQSIVDAVLMEADKNAAKHVKEIDIEVGELMHLDKRALSESLKLLMSSGRLKGSKVRIHLRVAKFLCRKCLNRWGMAEARKQLEEIPDSLLVREPGSKETPLHFFPHVYPSFIHCLKCGSADITTSDGEDVRLGKLVME